MRMKILTPFPVITDLEDVKVLRVMQQINRRKDLFLFEEEEEEVDAVSSAAFLLQKSILNVLGWATQGPFSHFPTIENL